MLGGKVVGAMSNYLEYDSLKLDANKEGFDVNSSLVASDYVITAFDYADMAGDNVYTHEVNGTVSQLANVRYEYNTGRSASYVQFKQKSRVSTKTLISTIIFKIN